MFEKSAADAEQTGSVQSSDGAAQAEAAMAAEIDLSYVRAVAADAIARGAKDSSIPWENPRTGAGGNITPLPASFSEGASLCRDFLASYVRGPSHGWLEGEACRGENGKWEVKSLKRLRS